MVTKKKSIGRRTKEEETKDSRIRRNQYVKFLRIVYWNIWDMRKTSVVRWGRPMTGYTLDGKQLRSSTCLGCSGTDDILYEEGTTYSVIALDGIYM